MNFQCDDITFKYDKINKELEKHKIIEKEQKPIEPIEPIEQEQKLIEPIEKEQKPIEPIEQEQEQELTEYIRLEPPYHLPCDFSNCKKKAAFNKDTNKYCWYHMHSLI